MVHKKIIKHAKKHHKKYLTMLTFLVLVSFSLSFGEKSLQIFHWVGNGFDMSSYHPFLPFMWILGSLVYLAILKLMHIKKVFFWIIGGSGLIFSLILLYGVYVTYWV